MAVLGAQQNLKRPGQPRVGAARRLLFAALMLAYLCGSAAQDDAPAYTEYEVKAAFVYKFAKFVEWPADAWSGPDDPLVVGILGEDPFKSVMEETVAGKTVRGRTLDVRRSRKAEDLAECHVVFVCASEQDRIAGILKAFQGKAIISMVKVTISKSARSRIWGLSRPRCYGFTLRFCCLKRVLI